MWIADLHLPAEIFWESSLAEITACLRAHAKAEDRSNYRSGLVASAIYNVHRGKDRPLIHPMDFFDPDRKHTQTREKSTEEMMQVMQQFETFARVQKRMKNG